MAVNSAGSVRGQATRRVPGPVAALGFGVLLLAVWAGLAGQQLIRASRHASQQTALTAQAIAGQIDATFARFTEQIQSVRPGDFAPTDRVQQTAQLLRLQILLPRGSATFMLGPDGHLRAASAPFLPADADVSYKPWFGRALAVPTTTAGAQALGHPWFGIKAGIVISRVVTDASGMPVGMIGAVVPRPALEPLDHPAWVPSGITAVVRSGTHHRRLLGTQVTRADTREPWLTRLMQSALHRVGEPTVWTASLPLHAFDGRVIATMAPTAVLPPSTLGRPVLASGAALVLVWLLGAVMLYRRPRGMPERDAAGVRQRLAVRSGCGRPRAPRPWAGSARPGNGERRKAGSRAGSVPRRCRRPTDRRRPGATERCTCLCGAGRAGLATHADTR